MNLRDDDVEVSKDMAGIYLETIRSPAWNIDGGALQPYGREVNTWIAKVCLLAPSEDGGLLLAITGMQQSSQKAQDLGHVAEGDDPKKSMNGVCLWKELELIGKRLWKEQELIGMRLWKE